MHTLTYFRSAKNNPPAGSGYYLAFLDDETLNVLYYSSKNKTWTYSNIECDREFSKCFERKVLAWSHVIPTITALSRQTWD